MRSNVKLESLTYGRQVIGGPAMPPVTRYRWDAPEYAEAFTALLRAGGGRERIIDFLRGLVSQYPPESRAVDWGAGQGDLTAVLLEQFRDVYAVEPNGAQRELLNRRCPAAHVVAGTIMSAEAPAPVEVGVISHVFYHVPDHKWGAHVVRAARVLSPGGVLLVALNDPDTEPNLMLGHFGAPAFDLYAGLADTIRRHPEFDFSYHRAPGRVRTASLEELLKVARFVLCDRDEDAFPTPPTEAAFQEYVRSRLWDDRAGVGGWDFHEVYCLVRPNPLFAG